MWSEVSGIRLWSDVGWVAKINNPGIHIAVPADKLDVQIRTIACHDSLKPFVVDELWDGVRIVDASSTVDAARMLDSGKVDACVTNDMGVIEHGFIPKRQIGFHSMNFVMLQRGNSWGRLHELREDFHGLEFIPFPLANIHYAHFLEHAYDVRHYWSEEGWKWKQNEQYFEQQ